MDDGGNRLRLRGEDNANVGSYNDMSGRLDHRHKVRLYVAKAGLWNPADASLCVGPVGSYAFAVR